MTECSPSVSATRALLKTWPFTQFLTSFHLIGLRTVVLWVFVPVFIPFLSNHSCDSTSLKQTNFNHIRSHKLEKLAPNMKVRKTLYFQVLFNSVNTIALNSLEAWRVSLFVRMGNNDGQQQTKPGQGTPSHISVNYIKEFCCAW